MSKLPHLAEAAAERMLIGTRLPHRSDGLWRHVIAARGDGGCAGHAAAVD